MISILTFNWQWQVGIFFTIFFVRSLLIAGGSSIWIHFSSWAKSKIIVPIASGPSYLSEIGLGARTLFLDALFVVAMIQIKLLSLDIHASATGTILTVVVLFVWVEIYFYYSHRILHHKSLYWIHRHHHQGRATNPWTSLSFSILERGILLFGAAGVPAIASQFLPVSFQGFYLYFLLNYTLNVYGHLNVEVAPAWFVETFLGKIFLTTSYHALHHLRYRGHYGLFTQVLDRIHGTKFADYQEFQKVASLPRITIQNSVAPHSKGNLVPHS